MISKKILKKISQKVMALFLTISLLFSNLMPLSTVFALTNEEKANLVEFRMHRATNLTLDNGVATATYEGGSVAISGASLIVDVDHNWDYGDNNIGNMYLLYTTGTVLTFNFYPEEGYGVAYRVDTFNPERPDNNTLTLDDLEPISIDSDGYDFEVEFIDETGGNDSHGEPQGRTYSIDFGTATWNVHGENVSATIDNRNLTDGFMNVEDDEIIRLNNFNPDTMEIRVYTLDGFGTSLYVNNQQETCLGYTQHNTILPDGEDLFFEVIEKQVNQGENGMYRVEFGPADWEIDGEYVAASIENLVINNGPVDINENTTIHFEGFNHETMQAVVSTEDNFATELFVDEYGNTCMQCIDAQVHLPGQGILYINVERRGGDWGQGGGNEPQEGNQTAIIRVNGPEGGYLEMVHDPDTGEDHEEFRPYDGPGAPANELKFNLNGGNIWMLLPEGESEDELGHYLYNEIEYPYNEEEGDTTVDIGLYTTFDKQISDVITINNTNYNVADYIDYENFASWASHVEGEYVGFVITVPKANDNIYNITVQIDPFETNYVGEFAWTNDPGRAYLPGPEGGTLLDEFDQPVPNPEYIPNVDIQLTNVYFELDSEEYNYNETNFHASRFEDEYIGYEVNSHGGFIDGHVATVAGATITMRITPKPGYQVTNISVPGGFTTTENPCEYTFVIPERLEDFNITVEEVQNSATASGSVITAADITLANVTIVNGNYNFIASDGTLDNNEKAAFENYADSYEIINYFNLDLAQILNKATNNTYWVNQLNPINKIATVSLTFDEELTYDEIVVIYKSGTTFETITPTSINNNTVTFETKKFGDFALAGTNLTEITSIDITLEQPNHGEQVNVWMQHDGNEEYLTADLRPIASAGTNAHFTIDNTYWVNGLCTGNSNSCNELFNGTFDKNGEYYAMIYISSKVGYKLTTESLDNITVNGQPLDTSNGDEIFTVYGNGSDTNTRFIVKIHGKSNEGIQIKGDFNNNNNIDLSDVIYCLKGYLGVTNLTAEEREIADINDDDNLTLSDVIALLRMYLGLD